MLRAVAVLAVVLLLVGGGAAGWWFGVRGEPLPFAGAPAEPPEAPVREPEIVELSPLTFPVVHDGQVSRLMTVVVALELQGEAARSAALARRPVVRDAMLSELHTLYGYRFVRERPDQVTLIKRRLLKAGRKVIGADLQHVYVQGMSGRKQQAQLPGTSAGPPGGAR
jgi:hypothetical protein